MIINRRDMCHTHPPSLEMKPSFVQTLANTSSPYTDLSSTAPSPVSHTHTQVELHLLLFSHTHTCFKNVLHGSNIGEVTLIEYPQLQLQCILVRLSIKFLYMKTKSKNIKVAKK